MPKVETASDLQAQTTPSVLPKWPGDVSDAPTLRTPRDPISEIGNLANSGVSGARSQPPGPAVPGAGSASVPATAGRPHASQPVGSPMPSTPAVASGATGPYAAHNLPIFSPEDVLAGRYRIVRFLAKGGMGEVYEAEDLELRQQVALKTVSAHMGADMAAVDRFKREIALARRVTHPNVCRIFDLGQHQVSGEAHSQPIAFLSMELLRGETLSSRLRENGRLAIDQALPLVEQMVAALDAAHRAKVVHRDFKCENVYLVPGEDNGELRAVVTDFGIARASDANDGFASQVTGLGIVGTPAYMAPEQVENAPEITAAADIYALGIVIFEMVTGKLPFDSANPLTSAVKRLQEPPPSPHVHVPDLPRQWEQTILRCLERRPEDRFASVTDVAEALRSSLVAGSAAVPASVVELPNPVQVIPPELESALVTVDPNFDRPAPAARSHSATDRAMPSVTSVPIPGFVQPPPSTGTTPPRATAGPQSAPDTAKPPSSTTVPTGSVDRRTALLAGLLAVVALLSGVLWWLNKDDLDPSKVKLRPAIAVLDFANITGNEDIGWLSTALGEMLATEISKSPDLRSVGRRSVDEARRTLKSDLDGELTAEMLTRVRGLVGCDYSVAGSFISLPGQGQDKLRLDLHLQDAARGTTLTHISKEGSTDTLFDMVAAAGSEIVEALGSSLSREGETGLPKSPQAAKLYSQALDALQDFRAEEAKDLLTQAAQIEGENARIHSALSSSWHALGFSSRATEEAQRAFDLSSGLETESRLLIEGRFREAQGDWQTAKEIYGTLWQSFPDQLDYGLGLVSAQISAREAPSALVTIDQLRRLPPPLSADPRIDLREAEAAGFTSQMQRQAKAASRAVEKSELAESPLLLGRALISLAQAERALGDSIPAAHSAQRALEVFTALDHQPGQGEALTALANARLDQGENDEAADGFRQALEIYRRLGYRGGQAATLNNLAVLRKRAGELDEAVFLYQQAETIYREVDDQRGTVLAANNRAVVLVERDQLADALELFQQARETWDRVGGPARAAALNNIAEVHRKQGDLAGASTLHLEALKLRQEAGLKLDQVISLANLGALNLSMAELVTSEEHLDQALALARDSDDPFTTAWALYFYGELERQKGRSDHARDAHQEALELRQGLSQRSLIESSRLALARLSLEAGDFQAAGEAADQARLACRLDQRRAEEISAATVQSQALFAAGNIERAQQIIDETAPIAAQTEQPEVRISFSAVQAHLAAQTDVETGRRMLQELAQQAESFHLTLLRLELLMADVQLARQSGDPNAARLLQNVVEEAERHGLNRLVSLSVGPAAPALP